MKLRLLLLVLAIAAVAGIAALVFYSRSEHHSASDSASDVDRIKIEMRAMPTATIHVDGKKVGKTPMNLQFPRSQRRIVVEATMMRHLIKPGATIDETYTETREITLERDQLLDFTLKTAKLVNREEKAIERPTRDTPTQPSEPAAKP